MLLIIEDTLKHQMAAKIQFPEAKVVNYDEAYRVLAKARPGELSGILTDLHFKVEERREIPSAPFASCYPKSIAAIGTEMPFGLAFVLKGVELLTPVVLYSDLDHHEDLFTGLLDMFGRSGCYPWRKGGESDPILNPKFSLSCDCSCRMAADMYWDGKKIVCEAIPPRPDYDDKKAYEAHWEKPVKDWRIAFQRLGTLAS